MSYSVNFYRFAKKMNSTKKPTSLPDETYTCEIMPGSSILAPTLKLNTNYVDPSNLTFAYIAALGRWYFVNDWRYDRGLWECSLNEDVLASYKTAIGNFSMYVLRSSSEMDGRIVDTSYPLKSGKNYANTFITNPYNVALESGYFIVGIINGDSQAIGVTSYYAFTNSEFRAFAGFLLGNTSYLNNPTEVSDALLKCLVNPTQYITSCIWVPYTPFLGSAISVIPIGWWTVTASCHRLSEAGMAHGKTITVTVPKHPDALTRGYYLLSKPYSSYYLSIPPFGAISIDPADVIDSDEILLNVFCDVITGQATCEIFNNPTDGNLPALIGVLHGQLGTPVALAQNAPELPTPVSQAPVNSGVTATYENSDSLLARAGKVWRNAKEEFTGSVSQTLQTAGENGLTNIANALISSLLPVQVIGGNGGFTGSFQAIKLSASFAILADDNTAEWGRPLCRTKKLNTLSGFIKCADTDFELNCTEQEREAIGRYLTGGFFYE